MLKSSVRTGEVFVMKMEEWAQVAVAKKAAAMERRVRGNLHARCGAGEKPEIFAKVYLSL